MLCRWPFFGIADTRSGYFSLGGKNTTSTFMDAGFYMNYANLIVLILLKIAESSSAQNTVPIKIEISDEGRSIWAFIPNGNDISLVQFPHPIRADGKRINPIKSGVPILSLKGHFQRVIACAYRKTHHQVVLITKHKIIFCFSWSLHPQIEAHWFGHQKWTNAILMSWLKTFNNCMKMHLVMRIYDRYAMK